MFVLKLCQQVCPDKIKFELSDRLGDGADGEVFDIKNQPNKVIKLCVLYEYPNAPLQQSFAKINNTLNYLMEHIPGTYARVYKYEYLGLFNRSIEWSDSGQNYILYYYVMEKLLKISEDEKKVFHSIICHEDRNLKKNYSIFKIKKMLQGMRRALDFDERQVIFFYQHLNDNNIIHHDIHVRNIMKDKEGNFKLIDFDRCDLKY